MRLDKYLKVSRLIKRRTVAKEACDGGRVSLNGRQAKAGSEVKAGDMMEIRFGSRVDVYLPAGTTPQVLLGQRTLAGETVIARIVKAEILDGVGQ